MTKEKKNRILSILLGMMFIYVFIFGTAFIIKSFNIITKYKYAKYTVENELYGFKSPDEMKRTLYKEIDKYLEIVEKDEEKECLNVVRTSIENNEYNWYDFNSTAKYDSCGLSKQFKSMLDNIVVSNLENNGTSYDLYTLSFYPLSNRRDYDVFNYLYSDINDLVYRIASKEYEEDSKIYYTAIAYLRLILEVGGRYATN